MIAISFEDIPRASILCSRDTLYILLYWRVLCQDDLFRALFMHYRSGIPASGTTSIGMLVFALFFLSIRFSQFVSVRLKKAPLKISRWHYFKKPKVVVIKRIPIRQKTMFSLARAPLHSCYAIYATFLRFSWYFVKSDSCISLK